MLNVTKPSAEIDQLARVVLRQWRVAENDGVPLRLTVPHRIYSEVGQEKKFDGWGYVVLDVASGAVVALLQLAVLEQGTTPILLSSQTRTGSICGRIVPALQKAEAWAAKEREDFAPSASVFLRPTSIPKI